MRDPSFGLIEDTRGIVGDEKGADIDVKDSDSDRLLKILPDQREGRKKETNGK